MPRRLEDEYVIQEALGSGSYAEVFRCTHKATGQEYAVKVINKTKAGAKGVKTTQNEVEILRSVRHDSIIYIKDAFESSSSIYMVLEVVSGGELFDKICTLKHYSESLAAKLINQLLLTLQYLHSQNVTHRDLKPENLLLKHKLTAPVKIDENGAIDTGGNATQSEIENILTNIKLVDFGFAVRYNPGEKSLTECCGTPNFIAPEILNYGIFKTNKEGYNELCDIWSTGVLCYILLCGYPPFHASNRNEMFKKISTGKFIFHKNTVWDKISPEAKDFISKLLVADPDGRYDATQALNHVWMKRSVERDDHLEEALQELKIFNARQKFRGGIFGIEAIHRLLYISKCKDFGIKQNSALVEQLSKDELQVLDLKNNYLGSKGLAAALQSISDSTILHTIILKDNQIDNAAVTSICDSLKNHPTITSIDLSNNPISQLAGRQLLGLLQNNPHIVELNLDGTFVRDTFLKKIEAQLDRNKARTRAPAA